MRAPKLLCNPGAEMRSRNHERGALIAFDHVDFEFIAPGNQWPPDKLIEQDNHEKPRLPDPK